MIIDVDPLTDSSIYYDEFGNAPKSIRHKGRGRIIYCKSDGKRMYRYQQKYEEFISRLCLSERQVYTELLSDVHEGESDKRSSTRRS